MVRAWIFLSAPAHCALINQFAFPFLFKNDFLADHDRLHRIWAGSSRCHIDAPHGDGRLFGHHEENILDRDASHARSLAS